MFFIGQNLNHVHMTYSFLELLIIFSLTQVDICFVEFISYHITELLYLDTNSKGNFFFFMKLKQIFSLVSLNIKIPYEQSFFLSFMNTFSEATVRRCSSK